MSELDDFNKFIGQMNDYTNVQLRQTLDFSKELSELFGVKDDPEAIIKHFDKALDDMKGSITGTG